MSRRESRPQPEFLVDRSLGSVIVPNALTAHGFIVHTLQTVYGEEASREVDDEVWLRDAGSRNWIVLAKDERIRRRPNELAAIRASRVKAFYLTAGGLTGSVQAEILLTHINRIIQRARPKGPMVWAITRSGIRRVL